MTAAVLTVSQSGNIKDYLKLMKLGVMLLVVFTGAVGLLCAPESIGAWRSVLVVIAIAMGSGAGAVFNMWYDADIDIIMQRTKNRPIPSGRVNENDALMLAITLSICSVVLLGFVSNWAAASMLAFAIWFYACFYTMILKRHTAQNIVIGGAAGAFPPIIGWLSASPQLAFEPICYFLIVFLWTPPHFWALALYRHDDYKLAGVPMLPVVSGEQKTIRAITFYSVLLIIATVIPSFMGYLGNIYLAFAVVLGGYFLFKAISLYINPNPRLAIGLFLYSILYLFVLFAAILFDKYFLTLMEIF
jgi:protoheme IX farnesyltransferase